MSGSKRVELNPKSFYAVQNENYNLRMSSIFGDIFSKYFLKENDYVHISNIELKDIKDFAPIHERDRAIESTKFNTKNYIESQYENMLMNLMVEGNESTFVLAGGMGSGKSTTCNFVLNKLRNYYESKDHLFESFEFDFNTLNSESDDKIIFDSFIYQLKNKLEYRLHHYFENNQNSFIKLMNEISKLNVEPFYTFRQELKSPGWNIKSLDYQINSFFNYIKREPQYALDKFLDLLKILKLYNKDLHYIIIIDNIDSLTLNNQRQIFSALLRYNTRARIKVFIPLRRATFIRNQHHIQQMASNGMSATHTYGYIHHQGVMPSEALKKKIHIVLQDIDEYNKVIPAEYRVYFKKRLENVYDLLQGGKNTPLSLFVNAVSGRSSRLAISVAKRLFVNNVVKYDEDFQYPDLAIKALMVGTNKGFTYDNSISAHSLLLTSSPELIYNIFSVLNDFSFLPFLVIYFVYTTNDSERRTIKDVFEYVNSVYSEKVSLKAFFKEINSLLKVQRPLMWSDDISYYDEESITKNHWSNTLHLTELGSGYIEVCLKNTQYIQECFISLYWNHEYVPELFESNTLVNRFKFLRNCIQEIFLLEKNNLIRGNYINPLSVMIFTTISSSFMNILYSRKPKISLKTPYLNYEELNEIMNYNSLVISLNNEYNVTISTTEQLKKIVIDI